MKQMKRAIEKGLWKLNNCSDGSVQTVKFGCFLMNHLHNNERKIQKTIINGH